ncbi:MAG: hypothetical protein FJ053_00170 [Cyanobacteria bacterium M_surface_10_m1_298]|nr:hypothetical protein [Cyanobacteria bacterium M_surface_10_m1_298]
MRFPIRTGATAVADRGVPLLLAVLALWDLRAELQLLADHFTWTSLSMIPLHHPLAVAVLLLTPALLRR